MLSTGNNYLKAFYDKVNSDPWGFYLFLFVTNCCIKFYNIAYDSYNLDEAWHMFYGQMPFNKLIEFARHDPNPPLYNILAGYWVKLFGISEAGVRSFSVLLSATTALLIFRFCHKHLGVIVAVWASLFFSVSEIHYMYAHNARVYALLSFLVMLSALQLFKLIQKPGLANTLLLTLCNAAVLFTHTVASFFFIVQGLLALSLFIKHKRTCWSILLAIVMSTLPFLLWVFTSPYYSDQAPSSWLIAPSWRDMYSILINFLGTQTVVYLFIGALFIWLVKTKLTADSRFDNRVLLFIITWALLPVILDAIVSHVLVPIWTPRYMLYASLAFYILFSAVLVDLFGKNLMVITIIGAIVASFSLWNLNFKYTKGEPWRDVAAFVRQHKSDETVVLISPYFQYPTFSFYYDVELYKDYEHTLYRLTLDDIHMADNAGVFSELSVDDYKKILFVVSQQKINNPIGLKQELDNKYDLIEEKQLGDIACFVYHNTMGNRSSESSYMDYENYDTLNMPTNIIAFEDAYSGKFVSVTSPTVPYSKGINRKLKYLESTSDSILVSTRFYANEAHAEGSLVCTLENKDSVYQWQGLKIQQDYKIGEWNELSFKVKIPKAANKNDVLKIYFWNTGNKQVYVDDLHYKLLGD